MGWVGGGGCGAGALRADEITNLVERALVGR